MAGLKDLAVDVEKMILAGNTVDFIVTGKQIGRAHV